MKKRLVIALAAILVVVGLGVSAFKGNVKRDPTSTVYVFTGGAWHAVTGTPPTCSGQGFPCSTTINPANFPNSEDGDIEAALNASSTDIQNAAAADSEEREFTLGVIVESEGEDPITFAFEEKNP